jgi:uncharacterized protein (TIGR02266 family)
VAPPKLTSPFPASPADHSTGASGAVRLLLVGDTPADRILRRSLARSHDVQCMAAPTGGEGLRLALSQHPDVVVLGVELADLSPREVCRQLEEDPVTDGIPVILLTRVVPHPLPEDPFQTSAVATAPTGIDFEQLLNLVHVVVGTRLCRRAHPRVTVALGVDYRWGDQRGSARTVNLSTGGMFLAVANPPAVGTSVDLCFALPDSDPLELTGRVVWRRPPDNQHPYPPGIAVQFSSLPAEARAAIAAFVQSRLPAPPHTA